MKVKLDARHDFLRRYCTPANWRAVTLGELADLIGGGTPSRGEGRFWNGGTVPWATPTDLTANESKYITTTSESITNAGLGSSGATLLPKGAVLYTSRATLGTKAIAKVPMATNQGFVSFIPRDIDQEFLYYLLDILTPIIKRLGAGTTFDEVSKRDIRKVHCVVPVGLEEQSAIACTLDAVDTAIERAGKTVTLAQSLDHSLLHELLDRGLNGTKDSKRPAHWQTKRVDEVAEVGSGVTMGKDITGYKYVELPYLRVANVQDGHLNLNTIKTVKVRLDEVERYRLELGDVLMTEGGDLDKLGRGTLWEGQIPDCLHQNHIFRVRADRSLLDPRFFSLIVESDIAAKMGAVI